jgi:hypothetical protein
MRIADWSQMSFQVLAAERPSRLLYFIPKGQAEGRHRKRPVIIVQPRTLPMSEAAARAEAPVSCGVGPLVTSTIHTETC